MNESCSGITTYGNEMQTLYNLFTGYWIDPLVPLIDIKHLCQIQTILNMSEDLVQLLTTARIWHVARVECSNHACHFQFLKELLGT